MTLAAGAAALLGVLVGIVVHLASSGSPATLTLPAFHGQGHWEAGQRPAPPFSLRDQYGRSISLAAQRGQTIVIAFLKASRGRSSGAEGSALAQAEVLLGPASRSQLDLVSLDRAADRPARVRAAVAAWGLRGAYHWLRGPPRALAALGREYGVSRLERSGAGAPLYLVDRDGFERAGYLYPFVPGVLARDIRTLER